nr:scaffolding protein [uncultured Mediterranean phage uvMED]BAR25344.1 scaffolding protein [uncultured Mediterranean phage uvMED]
MVDSIVINKDAETTAEKPVEEAQVETTEVEAAPEAEKILGKFDSQEDLEKAYKELESKIGSFKEETKEEPKENINQENNLEIQEKAEEVVNAANLDMEQLQNEFAENGKLNDDSLAKLKSVGISEDIVQGYIEGQQAVAKQIESDIKSVAGGIDGYTDMITWAKENLSADEVSAYNRVVNGRDIEATKLAVAGLKSRMNNDAEPNLIRGKAPTSQSTFESMAQITEAMKDPKYAKDPAFRKEVKAKIERSKLF